MAALPRDFLVLGINHLGIAPKDPERFAALLRDLGLHHVHDETVPAQKTTTSIYGFQDPAGQKGDPHAHPAEAPSDDLLHQPNLLEILLPTTAGEGPVAAFLEKKGSGIHHLALSVDDLPAAIRSLKALNYEFISEEPQTGVCNTSIAFLHPRCTGGILVELVQNPAM